MIQRESLLYFNKFKTIKNNFVSISGKGYVCMSMNSVDCLLQLSVRELVSEVDRTVSVDDAGERVQRAVVHIRNVLPEPRLVVHRCLVLRAHRGAESGL